MIDVKSISILNESISTLKETSKDDHEDKNRNIEYMTSSELSAVNFDKVKDEYIKDLSVPEALKSCDALYYNNSKEDYLIEFKNGKVGKQDIRLKITESLLVLTDIINQDISYTRKNLSFILVYNETKYPLTVDEKCKIQDSQSREYIGKSVSEKAKDEFIRFNLSRFKRLYFKDVYTVTKDEFETRFVKNWSKSGS
jgi:hypothetical protein